MFESDVTRLCGSQKKIFLSHIPYEFVMDFGQAPLYDVVTVSRILNVRVTQFGCLFRDFPIEIESSKL